jgi:hypothetical protein
MASRRPTLPTGYQVAGLPAVARPLHIDEGFEVYSLETKGPESEVLLLKRASGSSEDDAERLRNWLGKQDSGTLVSHTPVAPKLISAGFVGATLRLAGPRVADFPFGEASRASLKQLLLDMLDSGEVGGDEVPDFDPSLCWVNADGRRPICLRPLNRRVVEEPEQLRLVAEAFYRIAAGREARVGSSAPSALEKWARNAGPELSAVLGRCMAPIGQADRLDTFEAARSAIAGAGSSGATQSQGSSPGAQPGGPNHGMARVAGMHRLKALLEREVIAPIRDPEPFKRYGLTVPNGILLYGPPGCGKTYIARQLAEELGHYFVEIIPSELASPYIHQSVVRIRELFDEAAANAPSVIFIDEFEAMTPSRSELGAHQQHKAEEVNEFLAHLNSCADKGIFVIAATNQPNKIDPAVRRTGRLDKLIYVGPPDEEARTDMLALHLKARPRAPTLELRPLARALAGYSASDLKFLVDEAARNAFANKTEIGEDDFSVAMAKIRPSVPVELEEEYRSIEERG